jgi:hypothetical protein
LTIIPDNYIIADMGRPPIKSSDRRSQQVAIRMTKAMVKRIDDFAVQLQQQTPGIRFSRADAIRVIIERWGAETQASSEASEGHTSISSMKKSMTVNNSQLQDHSRSKKR